jgi:acetyl-CoA carboxylase biotin carboxylase subunit
MFKTVLIANRGEIAVRIARTCRELGIRTVAVYSTADRDSQVVRLADDAVHIGPAQARRSYLNTAAVIEAARQSGADAIHPGYGFLSEDADFAEICARNGIVFLGPPPEVLSRLGDKAEACALMAAAGLPVLAGGHRVCNDAGTAMDVAGEIGYPVIIKAVAGGGGKGMTVVSAPDDFRSCFRLTRTTAQSVFGDGRVYVEPFVPQARHVEIQILADTVGNVVSLGARDCSVQRGHQKLVEEAPPSGLPPELLDRMAQAAVAGGRAAGYTGVGTFEFLVDAELRFHFLEINCRIQVEHPVTEMVTGFDLVREQILVGAGQAMPYRQQDIVSRGAAIECRVNAEDPQRGFAPAAGLLAEFAAPAGPFTRVDTHGRPGMRIVPNYDSLLAKVVVWAPDREQALARMDRALGEFVVSGEGVRTTLGFLREVLAHPLFRESRHSTSLVEHILRTR